MTYSAWKMIALLLADGPPFGIPTAFYPALAIAVAVGTLFVKEIIVPGARAHKAEKERDEAQLANQEAVIALAAANKLLEKIHEDNLRREGRGK